MLRVLKDDEGIKNAEDISSASSGVLCVSGVPVGFPFHFQHYNYTTL